MGKPQRVLTGCPSCAMCTGRAFTGAGRTIGRRSADLATLGVTALARKNCKACAHPMAEHHAQVQQVQVVMVPQVVAPPPNPPGWYADPFDQRALCWWDGQQWHPHTKHYPPTV